MLRLLAIASAFLLLPFPALAQELPPETTVEDAYVHADAAWAHADENEWEDAKAGLERAIAASPDWCLDWLYSDYLVIVEDIIEMQGEGSPDTALQQYWHLQMQEIYEDC